MKDIRRGAAPAQDSMILQVLLHACGYELNPDGDFGAGTEAAVKKFQADHGLRPDGEAKEKTWTVLFSLQPQLLQQMAAKQLKQTDIEAFAQRVDLELPLVRTVYGVESGGFGFIGLKPKILFEGHVFWNELKAAGIDPRAHTQGNADILFEKYDKTSYKGGLAEYARLDRARKIAEAPALRSASWGLFQVMGNNAEWLGYPNVQALVAKIELSEADHLESFGRYIQKKKLKGQPLIELLRAHDWAGFALGYNGESYRTNRYDTKLAEAYERYAALPV
jgi:N-acetylmuramidase/Putative peptidoglycan binding domain